MTTKWLLVWIITSAAAADLPEHLELSTEESCNKAAATLEDMSRKAGMAQESLLIRARCIEVPTAATN